MIYKVKFGSIDPKLSCVWDQNFSCIQGKGDVFGDLTPSGSFNGAKYGDLVDYTVVVLILHGSVSEPEIRKRVKSVMHLVKDPFYQSLGWNLAQITTNQGKVWYYKIPLQITAPLSTGASDLEANADFKLAMDRLDIAIPLPKTFIERIPDWIPTLGLLTNLANLVIRLCTGS